MSKLSLELPTKETTTSSDGESFPTLITEISVIHYTANILRRYNRMTDVLGQLRMRRATPHRPFRRKKFTYLRSLVDGVGSRASRGSS